MDDNPGSRLVPRVGVDRSATEVASPAERKQILDLVRRGLEEGVLGVGVAISYTPAASRQEFQELFHVASEHHVPVYVHPRYAGPAEPGGVDALQELLSAAFLGGASVGIENSECTGRCRSG